MNEEAKSGAMPPCPVCNGTGEVVVVDEEVACHVPMPCWSCHEEPRRQVIARWSTWDGTGREHSVVNETAEGIRVEGVVIGGRSFGGALYYTIECDTTWRVRRLCMQLAGETEKLEILSDGAGSWSQAGGMSLPHLDGALDVDISVTPLTNSLPIRRLALKQGQEARIEVVYVRVPAMKVERVTQTYACLSPMRAYRYASLSSGAVHELEVDASGLVTLYPGRFRRMLGAEG